MAAKKTEPRPSISYGKFNFPVGTSESVAAALIALHKKGERIRVEYKAGYAKCGYVSLSSEHLLILCFDKRSQRGNVLGLRIVRITKTRKPYEVHWDMAVDDPVQFVMEV